MFVFVVQSALGFSMPIHFPPRLSLSLYHSKSFIYMLHVNFKSCSVVPVGVFSPSQYFCALRLSQTSEASDIMFQGNPVLV